MTNLEPVVALTALLRELTALTGEQAPSYRKLWTMTVDGRIPADQVNGRYRVRRADLPAIAGLVGLTVPGNSPAPKSRKATSTKLA